jgi:lipopolysaccharide transport system permease protein
VFVISGLLSSLINMLIGYGVWLAGWLLLERCLPPWTIVWMPVLLLPVCLMTAGISWVLASIGVFLRDISHAVGLATQVLFFATPIFYSLERVPVKWHGVLKINPLTHSIEDLRAVMMWGGIGPAPHPSWGWWIAMTALSAGVALLGYAFFMKSKRAFADVI